MSSWTAKEEKFLLDNFNTLTHKEIAVALNRSIKSVQGKSLNIRKAKNINIKLSSKGLRNGMAKASDETVRIARELYEQQGKNHIEISKELGYPKDTVYGWISYSTRT